MTIYDSQPLATIVMKLARDLAVADVFAEYSSEYVFVKSTLYEHLLTKNTGFFNQLWHILIKKYPHHYYGKIRDIPSEHAAIDNLTDRMIESLKDLGLLDHKIGDGIIQVTSVLVYLSGESQRKRHLAESQHYSLNSIFPLNLKAITKLPEEKNFCQVQKPKQRYITQHLTRKYQPLCRLAQNPGHHEIDHLNTGIGPSWTKVLSIGCSRSTLLHQSTSMLCHLNRLRHSFGRIQHTIWRRNVDSSQFISNCLFLKNNVDDVKHKIEDSQRSNYLIKQDIDVMSDSLCFGPINSTFHHSNVELADDCSKLLLSIVIQTVTS